MTSAVVNLAEQRLMLAIEAAQLGSWTWDMAAGTTTWDARLEEMHGLAPGGFGGTFEDWVASLHPEDRVACIATVEEALANPGPYILLHRTIWPDGSVHTVECRGTVLVDDDGNPTGTTGVAIDVTSRERLVVTLQQTLLPKKMPAVHGADVAVRYRAAEIRTEIGGDWYAVVPLADGRTGIAIGDVAGHGLDAVADMAAARLSLRALALTEPHPDVVFERLNQVIRQFQAGAMITALYGVLDPDARTWTYASAGHLPAVLRHGDGRAELVNQFRDPPLGVAERFRTETVALEPGATLVLYTDGLVERRGTPITDGLEQLRAACADGAGDPELLCDHVVDTLLGSRANEDDVALVVVTLL